jgi:hypothetical protein
MAIEQTPLHLVRVAESFHRGAFQELHVILSRLRQSAACGRLSRQQQALLLELAEYGLFYTCFYERLIQHMRASEHEQAERPTLH